MEYEKNIADEILNFGEILLSVEIKNTRWYCVYFKYSHYIVSPDNNTIIKKQDDYIGFTDIISEMLLQKSRSK